MFSSELVEPCTDPVSSHLTSSRIEDAVERKVTALLIYSSGVDRLTVQQANGCDIVHFRFHSDFHSLRPK